ncbi:hypothetical protein phiRKBJ001_4 [Streptomyces phage phiRKBJ001]|nr:hypothetical protein phiRKBJ001_4 [Streptomyces phage phiRKBJ001]
MIGYLIYGLFCAVVVFAGWAIREIVIELFRRKP